MCPAWIYQRNFQEVRSVLLGQRYKDTYLCTYPYVLHFCNYNCTYQAHSMGNIFYALGFESLPDMAPERTEGGCHLERGLIKLRQLRLLLSWLPPFLIYKIRIVTIMSINFLFLKKKRILPVNFIVPHCAPLAKIKNFVLTRIFFENEPV